jgi:hypothetical protein
MAINREVVAILSATFLLTCVILVPLYPINWPSKTFSVFVVLSTTTEPTTSYAIGVYENINKSDRRISDVRDLSQFLWQYFRHEYDIMECLTKDTIAAIRSITNNSTNITACIVNVEMSLVSMIAAILNWGLLMWTLHRVFVSVIYKSGYTFFMIRNLAEIIYFVDIPDHHKINGMIVAFIFVFLNKSLFISTGIGILDCVYTLWGLSTVFHFLKNMYFKPVENVIVTIPTHKNGK